MCATGVAGAVVGAIAFPQTAVRIAGHVVAEPDTTGATALRASIGGVVGLTAALFMMFLWCFVRAPYQQRNQLRRAMGALSRKPLNSKHEADLRSVLPLLTKVDASPSYRDLLLFADFEAHVPDSPVWRWREEYADLAPKLDAAIQQFRGRLPQLIKDRNVMAMWQRCGALESILTERFRQLLEGRPTPVPPWEWTFEPDDSGIGDVALDGGWVLASRQRPEEFSSIRDFVNRLWTEMPTWPEVCDRLQLEPRVKKLRTALEVHGADLQLTNLAGTGPCDHC